MRYLYYIIQAKFEKSIVESADWEVLANKKAG